MYIGIKISRLIFYIDHNLHLFSHCPSHDLISSSLAMWAIGCGALACIWVQGQRSSCTANIIQIRKCQKAADCFFQRVLYTELNWFWSIWVRWFTLLQTGIWTHFRLSGQGVALIGCCILSQRVIFQYSWKLPLPLGNGSFSAWKRKGIMKNFPSALP